MSRVLLILVLLALAGCGGGDSRPNATTSLRITVWPQGKAGDSIGRTLNCPRGGGGLSGADTTCSKLQQVGISAFAPVPPSTPCTEIYGGPQVAQVRGQLAGKPIRAQFERTNGCEIARWERLAFLFPAGP